MRYDLLESERKAVEDAGGETRPGLVAIPVTPEQASALAHASQTKDFIKWD